MSGKNINKNFLKYLEKENYKDIRKGILLFETGENKRIYQKLINSQEMLDIMRELEIDFFVATLDETEEVEENRRTQIKQIKRFINN